MAPLRPLVERHGSDRMDRDLALVAEAWRRVAQKVGELVPDIDILKEATNGRPFAPRTSDE